jgi:hypothetical protein
MFASIDGGFCFVDRWCGALGVSWRFALFRRPAGCWFGVGGAGWLAGRGVAGGSLALGCGRSVGSVGRSLVLGLGGCSAARLCSLGEPGSRWTPSTPTISASRLCFA